MLQFYPFNSFFVRLAKPHLCAPVVSVGAFEDKPVALMSSLSTYIDFEKPGMERAKSLKWESYNLNSDMKSGEVSDLVLYTPYSRIDGLN